MTRCTGSWHTTTTGEANTLPRLGTQLRRSDIMTNAREHAEQRKRTGGVANLIRYAMLGLTVAALKLPAQELPMPKPNMNWAPGQHAKIEGAIIARNGNDLLVQAQNSNEISVVTITDGTELESPSGVLN